MWPDRLDAVSRMIQSEQAVEELYREALRRWSPDLTRAVLPSLENLGHDSVLTASTLPPNPDGVEEAVPSWLKIAGAVIVTGVGLLWARTFVAARQGLGAALPNVTVTKRPGVFDPKIVGIVASATGSTRDEVRAAAQYVDADPALKAQREDYLDLQREKVAKTPGRVRDTVLKAVTSAGVELGLVELRATIADVILPESPEMSDIARREGYQAAGVENDAVLSAAAESTDEPLEKVWIATIDGLTRPSHFAADGQRAPLDGTFTVGDEELEYPGDPEGSAAETENCRCRVGVLAPDESLPDEVDRHTERLDGGDSTARNREGSQQDEIERRAEDGVVRAREDPEGIGYVAAAGGWQAPSEMEMSMTELTDSGALYRTFTDSVVAVIGTPTSDGRMLSADIDLTFRSFPLPLMWTKQSSQGHLDAYTVGVLEDARVEEGKVLASGYLLNTPESDEAAQQIAHGITGPSVDLAAAEWEMTTVDGKPLSEDDLDAMPLDSVLELYQTITKAELIGTTLVSTPAFGQTTITLNTERESRDVALVASASEQFQPRVYDPRLFSNPNLDGPTLPTMGDDGRIYGHLACFGACHRSIQSECVIAPRSRSNYSHFHTSPAVRLSDGSRLPVGRLTVGTGHAGPNLGGGPALAHYDNTGTCFALVRVGEDEHGIWFSGVAAPWATPEQIEMGLSAPLSGDWRDFGNGLELIAALAVNTPGFAARGHSDEQGRPIALVASLGPDRAVKRDLSLTETVKAAVVEVLAEDRARVALEVDRKAALERAATITTPPSPRDEVAALLARR